MIVGDGLKSGELKRLTKDLSLDGKAIFTGAVEDSKYIAACNIAVACFEDNEITPYKSPPKGSRIYGFRKNPLSAYKVVLKNSSSTNNRRKI